MNWPFALEAAAWMGGLTGIAIWMITGALEGRPAKRPRSDSEQQ